MTFPQWYWGHLKAMFTIAFSDKKKSAVSIIAALLALAPAWSGQKFPESVWWIPWIPTAIVGFCIVVFGPLWSAFAESHELRGRLSSLPAVQMYDVRLDDLFHDDTWLVEMRVQNTGGGTAVATVFAVALQDSHGNRIPRIDEPIPLHWRGGRTGVELFETIDAWACVIGIDRKATKLEDKLFLWKPRDERLPLFHPRLAKYTTQTLILVVRVVFKDGANGQFLATKERRVSITPDEKSEIGFRIFSLPS